VFMINFGEKEQKSIKIYRDTSIEKLIKSVSSSWVVLFICLLWALFAFIIGWLGIIFYKVEIE
jgi:hypothetical protein